MKIWIILLTIGLFFISSIFAVNAISNVSAEEEPISSCSSCGNNCNAKTNCGLSTCSTVSTGTSCGCNR